MAAKLLCQRLATACLAGLSPVLAINPATAWQLTSPPMVVTEPGQTGRRVNENGLLANYFPAAAGSPAVLLLGGSEGGLSEASKRVAIALQAEGFTVLQLSYFRGPGQNPRLENVPLEYFGKAIDWLARKPEADPERIVILGVSKGAEAGLLTASRRQDVRAVVAAMPSSAVWPGIDWHTPGASRTSSWSEGGKPLPYLRFQPPKGFATVRRLYEDGLATLDAHPEAAIAIERIAGPVLLICGEEDTLWPSCPMASQLKQRAQKNGKPDVTLISYAQAGHGGFGVATSPDDPRLTGLAASLGGTPAGNHRARAEGLRRVIAFLKSKIAD